MERNDRIYDLSGEYELLLDWAPCALTEPPEKYPLTMMLPGTTAQQAIGNYNEARESGFFTEKYPFSGQIWLRRVFHFRSEQLSRRHCFLMLERTRMTSLWVNGERIGGENSLCTPHAYDLSGCLTEETEIVICVKNTDYPTKGGHMTSPDTQTNWIGITGRMELQFHDEIYIDALRTFPSARERKVLVRGRLCGADKVRVLAKVSWRLLEENANSRIECRELGEYEIRGGEVAGDFALEIALPEDAPLWSEYDTRSLTLTVTMAGGSQGAKGGSGPAPEPEAAQVTFGLRDFKACGDHFEINGHPTFLRGKHDGMVFPLTGAAPTDKEAWAKVFREMKAWGINHYRFHTCCPPEAAFAAADEAGIYMQPELPFWGTVDGPEGDNYNREEQTYLLREGLRICQSYGNHPSFCMFSLGNELWGDPKHIGSLIRTLREADPRPLYTQGSNNFQFTPLALPEEDFWTGVRTGIGRLIRGSFADCDKPLGRIQTQAPCANWDYEEYLTAGKRQGASSANEPEEMEIQYGTGVKKVKAGAGEADFVPTIPAVSHEIGQYNVYPDYGEIEGYTGVLEARNLEIFRERLEKAGMGEQAKEFFECSGAFSRELYKMELEAAMRSPHLAGFQILDLQDFPGQGTALVGMLNARLENKGFVTPDVWRGFCGDLVPLAHFDSYVWTVGERVGITLAIRSSRQTLQEQKVIVRYSCGRQEDSWEVELPKNGNGYVRIGELEILPTEEGKGKLSVEIPEEAVENTWRVTVFSTAAPKEGICPNACERNQAKRSVAVAHTVGEATAALLEGKRVLLLTGRLDGTKSVKGFYCTDFWNYHMFHSISVSMGRQIPVGTMGLCMNGRHPIMRAMFSENYSTPQWYGPVTHSDCAVLDAMPAGYRPIVQMIDNVDRNHRLGLLYEAKVCGGSLMVCTVRFDEAPEDPAMVRLYRAILDYMSSEDFRPTTEATWEQLGVR